MGDINVDTTQSKNNLRIGKPANALELKQMPLIIRSKFYIYSEPNSKINDAQMASKQRLQVFKKQNRPSGSSMADLSAERILRQNLQQSETIYQNEKIRHERLIGQLKAAEARNRIRMMKMRYLNNRNDDIEYLIECQPTAIKAVRLEAFLSAKKSKDSQSTNMTKEDLSQIQRRRLEALVDDTKGLLINRSLY